MNPQDLSDAELIKHKSKLIILLDVEPEDLEICRQRANEAAECEKEIAVRLEAQGKCPLVNLVSYASLCIKAHRLVSAEKALNEAAVLATGMPRMVDEIKKLYEKCRAGKSSWKDVYDRIVVGVDVEYPHYVIYLAGGKKIGFTVDPEAHPHDCFTEG